MGKKRANRALFVGGVKRKETGDICKGFKGGGSDPGVKMRLSLKDSLIL